MGFGMGREQAERSAPSGTGLAGGPRCARDGGRCREGLPAGDACKSPRALRWGSRSGPSSSLSPLRAQGALHLGGLQQRLALLQLKPLELKRECCCRDTSTPVAILWRHPS